MLVGVVALLCYQRRAAHVCGVDNGVQQLLCGVDNIVQQLLQT